ncbi:hypothetical protein TPAR_05081, partial [Tolypocladium paradoxum]
MSEASVGNAVPANSRGVWGFHLHNRLALASQGVGEGISCQGEELEVRNVGVGRDAIHIEVPEAGSAETLEGGGGWVGVVVGATVGNCPGLDEAVLDGVGIMGGKDWAGDICLEESIEGSEPDGQDLGGGCDRAV